MKKASERHMRHATNGRLATLKVVRQLGTAEDNPGTLEFMGLLSITSAGAAARALADPQVQGFMRRFDGEIVGAKDLRERGRRK